MKTSYFYGAIMLALAFGAGCGSGSGSRNPVVPNEGTYAWLQANLDAQNNLQLAATVYDDGQKVDLVGGDVINVTQGEQRVQLKGVALRSGDYAGVIANADDATPVVFSVDYEPEASRDDRWYPTDILRVDPGAGALVGLQVQATLPQRVQLLAPVAASTVVGRLSEFPLDWQPAGEGDAMRVAARVTCVGDGTPIDYALNYPLGEDDGHADLRMSLFVPDQSLLEFADVLINSLAQILIEAMYQVLFFGLFEPEFNNPFPATIDRCEIDLVLFREREAEVTEGFDGGLVLGSTSAAVRVIYQPGE